MFSFKSFMKRKIVSFDFDGVLHTSMAGPNSTAPYDFWTSDLEPNGIIFQKVKEEARRNKVVVVSSRDPGMESIVWEFIQKYNLPISAVYCLGSGAKLPALENIGAIRHYDDSHKVFAEFAAAETDVELIKV